MSIDLITINVRHERRLRLFFTNTLAAGAFSALTFYTVVNQDGAGPDPNVVAAYAVPNSPACVELALDQDIVDGGLYLISAIGVPAVDTSVTPAGANSLVRVALAPAPTNIEPAATVIDRAALMYFRDIVFNGTDLVEDASGDLAVVSGEDNAVNAVIRADLGEPLPWAPSYSARARSYVDGPSPSLDDLRAALVRSASQDPRVASSTATVSAPLSSDGSSPQVAHTIQLIGGRTQTKSFPLRT